MNLTDLDDDERLALIALVVQLMRADGVTSEDELAELQDLGSELGAKAFDKAYVRAREEFTDFDAALAFAKDNVLRPEARELIHTVLFDMAMADGVSDDERALVAKVKTLWEIFTIPR